MQIPKIRLHNVGYQPLIPLGEASDCLNTSPLRIAMSGMGFWQDCVSASPSVSYSTLGSLDTSHIIFLSQMFLGTCFSVADPKVWSAWCGTPSPHSYGTRAGQLTSLPNMCSHARMWVLWNCISASHICLSVALWSFVVKKQFLKFSDFFSRGKLSICSCAFGVFMGVGKLRIFLQWHL